MAFLMSQTLITTADPPGQSPQLVDPGNVTLIGCLHGLVVGTGGE
jgi:hypothetical protein